MSRSHTTTRLAAFLTLSLFLNFGLCQSTQDTGGDVPLYTKKFTWPNLPQQADTGTGPRGTQQGKLFSFFLLSQDHLLLISQSLLLLMTCFVSRFQSL